MKNPPCRASAIVTLCLLAHLLADPITDVRNLTGAHTRLAWCADIGGARGSQIWGFDTNDGKGERVIVKNGRFDLCKFTDDGNLLVLANHKNGNEIWIVNFDGSGYMKIRDGQPVDIWTDPGTGNHWVFYSPGTGYEGNRATSRGLYKVRIDDPDNPVKVYDGDIQGRWASVSADGRYAAAQMGGWSAGVIDLASGKKTGTRFSKPWANMAPDNCYKLISYTGGDKGFTIRDADAGNPRNLVPASKASGWDDKNIGHIAWSTDKRYYTTEAQGSDGHWNRTDNDPIYGHIYMGRLAPDLGSIDAQVKVTSGVATWKKRYFRYAHAWIERDTTHTVSVTASYRQRSGLPSSLPVGSTFFTTMGRKVHGLGGHSGRAWTVVLRRNGRQFTRVIHANDGTFSGNTANRVWMTTSSADLDGK